jgi:hypothetical protein
MNTTRLAGVGSLVMVASGKKAGLTGVLRSIYVKWNRSEEKVLWRSACIEVSPGQDVWVNFRHVVPKG